jgi:hypothetical protein
MTTKKPIYPPPTKTVERWEDVPVFKDEHEEARFWAEHGLAGEALESMQPVPPEGDDWLPPARAADDARGWRTVYRGKGRRRPVPITVEVELDDAQSAWVKEEARRTGRDYASVVRSAVEQVRGGAATET